jgi:hypothetical protein
MSQTVYAYKNASLTTVMVDENSLNFTGTWASTGTYLAASRDVANYGASRFIAVVDNINVVPTSVPRRGQPYRWSDLVVVRPGVGTNDPAYDLALLAIGVANTALAVGNGAFSIAVAGTNLADEALRIAIDGTNSADDAKRPRLPSLADGLEWHRWRRAALSHRGRGHQRCCHCGGPRLSGAANGLERHQWR